MVLPLQDLQAKCRQDPDPSPCFEKEAISQSRKTGTAVMASEVSFPALLGELGEGKEAALESLHGRGVGSAAVSEPGSPQHRHALQTAPPGPRSGSANSSHLPSQGNRPTRGAADTPPPSFSAGEGQALSPHHDLGWPRGFPLHPPRGTREAGKQALCSRRELQKNFAALSPLGDPAKGSALGTTTVPPGQEGRGAAGGGGARARTRAPFPAHQKHFLELRWGRSCRPCTWQWLLPAAERAGAGNPTSPAKSALRQLLGPGAAGRARCAPLEPRKPQPRGCRLPGSRQPAGCASAGRSPPEARKPAGTGTWRAAPRRRNNPGRAAAAARTPGHQWKARPRPRPLPGDPRGPKGSLYESSGDITRRQGPGTRGRGLAPGRDGA
ncbi:hypothetical protein AAY473_032579 [Plecturocebus cupreus]